MFGTFPRRGRANSTIVAKLATHGGGASTSTGEDAHLARTARRGHRALATLAAVSLGAALSSAGVAASSIAGPAVAASATTIWYAYPNGGVSGTPASCPQTPDLEEQCTLTQALAAAQNGDAVELATGGPYVGNFAVTTSVTIAPAPGVGTAVLDGASGIVEPETCPPGIADKCLGPVLTISPGTTVTLSKLTVEDANNTSGSGGGVYNQGALAVQSCSFDDNAAAHGGGAIDSGSNYDGPNPPSVSVSASTFSDNQAAYGGAINNAENAQLLGRPSVAPVRLSVTDSTFYQNHATDGGGIDNGEGNGYGTVSVTDSSFTADTAVHGGALMNADNGSRYPLVSPNLWSSTSVLRSTFDANVAASGDGGAIDNADGGSGATTVSVSTFVGNEAGYGGAIANAWNADGNLSVTESTFTANRATLSGQYGAGAIDIANAYNPGVIGNVTVGADVFGESTGGASDCSQAGSGGGPTRSVGWTDGGYNAGSDSSCYSSPTPGTDAVDSNLVFELSSLLPNPGPGNSVASTETVAPVAGGDNPVIGLIPANTAGFCPTTDQRGVASSGACDAGAVQGLAVLYAFANGSGAATYCNDQGEIIIPPPGAGSDPSGCDLTDALGQAQPGDVVELASSNTFEPYTGNFTISNGTPSAPVSVIPEPTIAYPEISGSRGAPALTVDAGVTADVLGTDSGIFIENASNPSGDGGGIADLGNLTLSQLTLSGNSAAAGGGVYVGPGATLSVAGTHFYGDHAVDGGAIDTGDGVSGTVSITSSDFGGPGSGQPDTATDGGAIDAGDNGGSGSVTIAGLASGGGYNVFNGNSATTAGGAIDVGGTATLNASRITFWGNGAADGGAVALASSAVASISQSVFAYNAASGDGGAVDSSGSASLSPLAASTFMGNRAAGYGGAVENSGDATLLARGLTFVGDSASSGPAIDNGTPGGSPTAIVAADVFDEACSRSPAGGWNDQGYNVGRDATCLGGNGSDRLAGSALDGELAAWPAGYGAPIDNVPLVVPNPAIGLVPASTSNGAGTLCPTTDETGHSTDASSACDAGAMQDVVTATNGSGSMSISPSSAAPSSTGTYTLTYKATGYGVYLGALSVAVPAGWTAPSTATNVAGSVSESCPGATLVVAGQDVLLDGFELAGGSTCTITYSSATAPSGTGNSVFATSERSNPGGSLVALATSPSVSLQNAGGAGSGTGGGGGGGSGVSSPSGSPGSPRSPGAVTNGPLALLSARLSGYHLNGPRRYAIFAFACKNATCATKAALYEPTKVTLTAKGPKPAKNKKRATIKKTVTKLVLLGSAKVALQAGKAKVLRLELDKTGRKLLAKATLHHPITVDLVWTLPGEKRHAQKVTFPLRKLVKATKKAKRSGAKG